MNCLQNLVGLRHCTMEFPSALFYLNDLPGINMNMVAGIKEKEDDLLLNFELMKQRAFKQMEAIATSEMSKRYKLKTVSETYQINKVFPQNLPLIPASNQYRGFTLSVGNGAFSKIHIGTLEIYSKNQDAILTEIKIFDLTNPNNIQSIDQYSNLNLTYGWNKFPINKSYSPSTIFVGYYSDILNSSQNQLNAYGDCGCDWNCAGCELSIRGGTMNLNMPTMTNTSYGLAGNLSMVCDFSKVLCNYTDTFGELFNWFTGIEFMKERLVSDRLNRWTTIDSDKANQWLAIYKAEKEAELRGAFQYIDLRNDCCVECNPKITTSTWL